jgi:hypothetical protein
MAISIGGAEAAGFFKEAIGFDSEREIVEARATNSASSTSQSSGARPAGAGSSISGEATEQHHKPLLEILSHQWPGSVKA